MKINKSTILLSVILTIALWFTACSTPTVSRDDSEDIPDSTLYKLIAYTLIVFESDAYNQNFAGKPTGDVDIRFEGTYGGSVKVTGSNSRATDVDITTATLVYTLDNVKQISSANDGKLISNITFNGAIKVKGSFNESYTSKSFSSSNLTASGTITYGSSTREFSDSGSVNISISEGKVTAEVFGHTVAW